MWTARFAHGSVIVTFCALGLALDLAAEEWSRFRGPNGSGISQATGYPVDLGEEKVIAWRSPIRPGKSSPVLTANHVFLAGYEDDRLYTQCLDRATGELVWERSEPSKKAGVLHDLNEPASVTPVSDGENVYVFFRDFGVVSYDAKGGVRWKAPLEPFTNEWGLAASPIIADDGLILTVDQSADSYIAALALSDGEMLWRTPRSYSSGWATPILRRSSDGKTEIVTAADRHFDAYLASTGEHVWSYPGLSVAVVASPIIDSAVVYGFSYGYESLPSFDEPLRLLDANGDGVIQADEIPPDQPAVYWVATQRGDKDGAVTRDEWDAAVVEYIAPSRLTALALDQPGPEGLVRELWRDERSFIGVVPSPLFYEDVLYVVKNGGILTSFDAETGEVLKAGRLRGALERYFASPVAAEGRIYFVSEAGEVSVVKAGRDWEVLGVYPLGEETYATPALSEGRIYVRKMRHLYCFAKPDAGVTGSR